MSDIILIFSTDMDWSTSEVMNWIDSLGMKCLRINSASISDYKNTSFVISNDGISGKLRGENILSVWFRRGPLVLGDALEEIGNVNKGVRNHIIDEIKSFQDLLFSSFDQRIRTLGTNSQYLSPLQVSKTKVLIEAQKVGFNIPATLITSSKQEVIDFKRKYARIITKPLSNPIFIWGENNNYAMYTSELTDEVLRKMDDHIFPSLFQEYIPKEFEIRVFFLNRHCYAAAIFSQNDNQTKLDFRNYNDTRPNRTAPFKLPGEIVEKIINLMNAMGLNTGSLDFIKNQDGEYVFLEVNPVGQFGMVSKPCNYYLEEKIALFLTENTNEGK